MANFEICRDLYVRYDDLAIDLLRKETSLLLYFTICLVITLSKTCVEKSVEPHISSQQLAMFAS